jgi:hypothetical protein
VKRSAALLALLAVVAAGCGAATTDPIALDPVAQAASRTAAAGSSRVEFEMNMRVAGQSLDAKGWGAFTYGDPRGFLTFEMRIPELGDVRMDLRLVGLKLYLRLPAEVRGEALPRGKEWMGIDLAKSLEQAGLGSLDFTRQQDPVQMLRYLQAASSDVAEAGYDEIRGVPTTKYVGHLDVRKALDAGLDQLGVSEAEREQARAGMKAMLDQLGSASVPFEVFIDESGLLRRLTMTMSMTVENESLEMSMQMDYFDFGVAVEVEPPPAAAVYDVTDLATLPTQP